MKVKIGEVIYDSNTEPIMLILSPEEKNCIGNMGEQTKFLSFPTRSNDDLTEMVEFMKIENEEGMNKEKPYLDKDYKNAKKQGLDLDNWNDYVKYYELGEQN